MIALIETGCSAGVLLKQATKEVGSTSFDVWAMARLAGFEPATYGLEVRCSIQLSYRRTQI